MGFLKNTNKIIIAILALVLISLSSIQIYYLYRLEIVSKNVQKNQNRFFEFAASQLREEKKEADIITDTSHLTAENAPTLGLETAPVKIYLFQDYQCPYCIRFHKENYALLKEQFIDKGIVQLIYIDYPLPSLHSEAFDLAKISRIAFHKGKFWETYEYLMDKELTDKKLTDRIFKDVADIIGISVQDLKKDMSSREIELEVWESIDDGKLIPVAGTPSIVLNNKYINGLVPFNDLSSMIHEAATLNEFIIDDNKMDEIVNDSDYTILDVRTEKEFNGGAIPHAVNSDMLDSRNFDRFIRSLDRDNKYLVYCKSGKRAIESMEKMKSMGFTSVYIYEAGYDGWSRKN